MIARSVRLASVALVALVQACSSADDGSDPTPDDPNGLGTEPTGQMGEGGTAGEPAPSATVEEPPMNVPPTDVVVEPDPPVTAMLETVLPTRASEIIDSAPGGLVVLDVRTPAEFAEGHIAGAILVDFYEADFDAQLAELDPAVPYVLYCRSGNRSGQTMPKLEGLGFVEVYEIEGGIVAWGAASLPIVMP